MRHQPLMLTLASATTVALVAALGGTPATATPPERASTTRSWTSLSATPVSNFADPAVARTADGLVHVVWRVDLGHRQYTYEHTTVSRTGAQGPVSRLFPGTWNMLDANPDLGVNADGTLRLAFSGSQTGAVGGTNFFDSASVFTAVSSDGGATWALPNERFTERNLAGGSATLAYLPDGTPVAGHADSGGFSWHVGTVPEAASATQPNQSFNDSDVLSATLVSDDAAVWVFYQSHRADGVFARQVWPVLGAAVKAPGSSFTNPSAPLAATYRPGYGPVAAFMRGGKAVLWELRTGTVRPVRALDRAAELSIDALPDGHLWLGADGPSNYANATVRVARRGWAVDRRSTSLGDLAGSYGHAVAGVSATRAEFFVVGGESGQALTLRSRTSLSQLTVKATPQRWPTGRTQRVRFTVRDVDGRVARVKLRGAGRSCTTNAAGTCRIRFPHIRSPRKITMTAKHRHYVSTKVKLQVKRR